MSLFLPMSLISWIFLLTKGEDYDVRVESTMSLIGEDIAAREGEDSLRYRAGSTLPPPYCSLGT